MKQLLQHPRVSSTLSHLCMFGLTTPGPDGKMQLAKNNTFRFLFTTDAFEAHPYMFKGSSSSTTHVRPCCSRSFLP